MTEAFSEEIMSDLARLPSKGEDGSRKALAAISFLLSESTGALANIANGEFESTLIL